MKLISWGGLAALLSVGVVGVVAAPGLLPARWKQASTWHQASNPGPLSGAHAFLKNNCAACHTSGKVAEGISCITCHASNAALLQSQPTAFHADITMCVSCHIEHQGGLAPTQMNHAALAKYGLLLLEKENLGPQSRWVRQHMNKNEQLRQNRNITAVEATLNCVTCHATKDRHQGFFGTACASCHGVTNWTIPKYRHPSPNSRACMQCHQAPPSHYMMHFKMVSAKVAGQPSAKVNQCYSCHQTTSWNDIKGVGWYDHH